MGSIDGFDTVKLISPAGTLEAEFVPHANMLCHSLRHHGVERLYQRYPVRQYAEHGKTTGIPLLYPWANRLSQTSFEVAGKQVRLPEPDGHYELDPNGLPRHGAIPGLLRWVLEAGELADDRLVARLRWTSDELLGLYPFVHELEYSAQVGDEALRISTVLHATGDDDVPVAFGFHPYLHVPGVPRARWQVALGASRRLTLDERLIPTGETDPLPHPDFELRDQSWDDGLAGLTDPPRFAVAAEGSSAAVVFEQGYDWAQVYAPPGEDLIAFEPMTAPTNALVDHRGLTVVPAGGEYRAAFHVAIT